MNHQNQVDKTIRFNHASDACVEASNGVTSFSDVFTIGAMALTAKTTTIDGMCFSKDPTDKAGLKITAMKSDELLDALLDATQSISVLMAYCENSQIQEKFQSLAWLVTGLGELSGMVARAGSDMNHALLCEHQQKQFSEKEFASMLHKKMNILITTINQINSEPMNHKSLSAVLTDAENVAHLTAAAVDRLTDSTEV